MSDGLGALVKAGILKDPETSSYPYTGWAADAIGAGDGIPLVSVNIPKKGDFDLSPSLQGAAGHRTADLIGWDVEGNFELEGQFNDIGIPLMCALGYECPNDSGATYHGSPEVAGGKYLHVFEPDAALHTQAWASDERLASGAGGGTWDSSMKKVRRFAKVASKGVSDYRWLSCMVKKMTVTLDAKRVIFSFDVVCYNRQRGDYSTASITYSTDTRAIIFPLVSFSINGTAVRWASGRIEVQNPLEYKRNTASGLYIPEPHVNGERLITVGWNDPIYDSDSLMDDMEAGTIKYAAFEAESGAYNLGFFFDALQITDMQNPVNGPEMIKMDHTAMAVMPSVDHFSAKRANINLVKGAEMWVRLTNDYSSNYLTAN